MPERERARIRRTNLQEARAHAESRYASYLRAAKDMLYRAESEAHGGNWAGAANELQAALAEVSAGAGVCRELGLLYLLMGERDDDASTTRE